MSNKITGRLLLRLAIRSLVLVVLTSAVCEAQVSLGIEMGVNRNYHHMDLGGMRYVQCLAGNGYEIGLPVDYRLRGGWRLRAIPQFSSRSFSLVRTGPYSGIYDRYSNQFLQLPVLAAWGRGIGRLRAEIEVGGFISYWRSARVKGVSADVFSASDSIGWDGQVTERYVLRSYDAAVVFDRRRDQRLGFGWVGGLSIRYQVLTSMEVYSVLRYQYPLRDMQREYMLYGTRVYDRVMSFSAGVSYSIKR